MEDQSGWKKAHGGREGWNIVGVEEKPGELKDCALGRVI